MTSLKPCIPPALLLVTAVLALNAFTARDWSEGAAWTAAALTTLTRRTR